MKKYNVVILGGGSAGCATALALRLAGVENVLVVEASEYDAVRIGESIPPDSRVLLQKLGVWEPFLLERHEPCLGSCSAWGSAELGYNDFLFNPHGHGWHLDRRRFDAFLARMVQENGVELWANTTFVTGERGAEPAIQLRLMAHGDPFTVQTRFVVDATGSRAVFARQMGARQLFQDRLICVSGFFDLPHDAEFSQLTMLEATEFGWWYAAKLPGGKVVTAVASDPEYTQQATLTEPESWLAHLHQTTHIASALSACQFDSRSLIVHAAGSYLLDKIYGDGWLAVGDAAAAFDPIASQGIYKALSDGIHAAECIAADLRGDDKFEAYQIMIVDRFDDYLKNRAYLYGLENRWLSAPFWQRRRERTVLQLR